MEKESGNPFAHKARDKIYKIIFENTQDCIFCKDRDFKYTHANPAMLRLLNSEETDIIGKTPEEVFGKEAASIISEVDLSVLEGETVDTVRALTIDNRYYLFRTIQIPIFDDKGRISGICGFVRDVTERMKADSILHLQSDLSIEFSKAVGLEDVLKCLIEHLLKIEFVDVGGIYLRGRDTGALDLVIHQGLPDAFVATGSHYDAESP